METLKIKNPLQEMVWRKFFYLDIYSNTSTSLQLLENAVLAMKYAAGFIWYLHIFYFL